MPPGLDGSGDRRAVETCGAVRHGGVGPVGGTPTAGRRLGRVDEAGGLVPLGLPSARRHRGTAHRRRTVKAVRSGRQDTTGPLGGTPGAAGRHVDRTGGAGRWRAVEAIGAGRHGG
ncbi:hypothetical protein AB0R12_23460, partial [Streptomyces niveus]|uniref:hypothetical protein n=1 Tax=Streptomyces niveus TaxID=193462 RepID=UPI00342A93E1